MLVPNSGRLLPIWFQQAKLSWGLVGVAFRQISEVFQGCSRTIALFLEDFDLFVSFAIARWIVWRAKKKKGTPA